MDWESARAHRQEVRRKNRRKLADMLFKHTALALTGIVFGVMGWKMFGIAQILDHHIRTHPPTVVAFSLFAVALVLMVAFVVLAGALLCFVGATTRAQFRHIRDGRPLPRWLA